MAQQPDITTLTESARKERTRIMLRAALVALDADERARRAEADRARRLLAEVETWLGGGSEPEMFGQWRTIHRDLFAGGAEPSEELAARAIYEQRFSVRLQFTSVVIGSVLDNAAGIDLARWKLGREVEALRYELLQHADELENDVAEIFDGACSSLPGMAELLGERS